MRLSAVSAACLVAACLAAAPVSARVEAPLVDAVRAGDVAEVRALLAGAADPDQPSLDGTTALHWAANRDDLDSARLLLEAGARAGAAHRYGAAPLPVGPPNGQPPLLPRAVRALLRHGAAVDATERWRGQTALMWAAIE
ncbi:MAG: ankyrin repeat domain-containing protein, partial [Acidobacteria bacterium]|nr:ankyrin repeat domain-containing protein [Acidobacteriota bacterium]